jgi:hypothetical protein
MSGRARGGRVGVGWLALVVLPLLSAQAQAQTQEPQAQEPQAASEEEDPDAPEGFTLPAGIEVSPPLVLMGYVDVGFVDAEGDGTSYTPGDTRLPADYGVDTFAPAVNSRGDVASNRSDPLFNNGFLPRSLAVGGRPSFVLNVVDFDARYQAPRAPIMVFTRMQILPRFVPGGGEQSSVYLEQAFGRVTPIHGKEFFISAGKFDSVFGIEYLENQSNYRTGVTPSLLARYSTGTSVGVKAFFRQQIAPLWSAISLNAAATNSGNFVEALQPTHASLTGMPVVSARLGYELNLPLVQLKLGGSGLRGPRNDQHDRQAKQRMWGADARLYTFGLSLSGELLSVKEDLGSRGKETGMGAYPVASEFRARGFWFQAAYGYRFDLGALSAVTIYTRYERRRAEFEGFRRLLVGRLTSGLRVDLWDSLILKVEVLFNEERYGAPEVDNDVFTSSVIYTW